ncbi:MAG: sulfurtransferase [Elainellaceae cyanobacterium]
MLEKGIASISTNIDTKIKVDIKGCYSSVVSASWLYQNLNDSQVVVIDSRFALSDPQLGKQQYIAGHIPGAFFLDLNEDLSSPVQPHGGRHPLPDPIKFAEKLTRMGVYSGESSSPSQIVVYDDSRLAFAARLWWLLRYMGYDQVAVLDGGFQGWQRAGYPISQTVPSLKDGNFVPRLRSDWVATIEDVKSRKDLPGVVLIDSREHDRYQGIREPIDPIAGHIPGAVNYPWQEVTDAEGYIHPLEMHQQRWADLATASEVIVYCGSGVTACVNALSLEIAGISSKLYAGSWSDWCSYLQQDR